MHKNILITGGAGFIGSHLADKLISKGYNVRVMDVLIPQVHGENAGWPAHLNNKVERVKADVRDKDAFCKALNDMDAVFHFAAEVGVGQSMYEIERYVDTNTRGTAVLLDILANRKHSIKKLIVASSMSAYGEGLYKCKTCGAIKPPLRGEKQLALMQWEMKCPLCEKVVSPVPTSEEKELAPTSIYAITKKDQEEMCLNVGKAYNIATVALRFFNVYGPGQALSNPYTGVAAIFSGRLLNSNKPVIFEDGLQSRDFIHVDDIVQANILCLEKKEADYEMFNVGTGRSISVLELADILGRKITGKNNFYTVMNSFRKGDIRHCFADISKISKRLGFKLQVVFEDGIEDLIKWVKLQTAVDKVDKAVSELVAKGLTIDK